MITEQSETKKEMISFSGNVLCMFAFFTVNIELFMKRITIKLSKWTSEQKNNHKQPYSINDRFIEFIFNLKKINKKKTNKLHRMFAHYLKLDNWWKLFQTIFGIVETSGKNNANNSPRRKSTLKQTVWLNMKTESIMVNGLTRCFFFFFFCYCCFGACMWIPYRSNRFDHFST